MDEAREFSLSRRYFSEFLGTALLLATVIGSGIMGENLAGGNIALVLLVNTIATGAILVVLIGIFGAISGAHFNPAVTMAFLLRGELSWCIAFFYIIAQITGGLVGVIVAHAMFAEPLLQVSLNFRDGASQGFSEFIATFGLLATILGTAKFKPDFVHIAVGLYITAAYWFTASTSFANPAVTIARSFSNTFAGIAPSSVLLFILMQLLGALVATIVFGWLLQENDTKSTD